MDFTAYENHRFTGYEEFKEYLEKPYGDPPKTKKPENVKNYLACISWILLEERITFQYLCDNISRYIEAFKSSSFRDKGFIVNVLLSIHYYINPRIEKTTETPKTKSIPIPNELLRFWEAGTKTDFYHYLKNCVKKNGDSYSSYTCTSYAAAILFVKTIIQEEITQFNISNIVYSFGNYGKYKEYGDIGHQTIINALRRYREFLFQQ
jgi:hypothetical protein